MLLRVAVQIEDVNLVEGLEQVPAHSAERGVVEEAVRIDVGDDPASVGVFLHVVLGEADELHVVVVEPLGIALGEPGLAAGLFFVILHGVHDPLALVLALTAVRRVSENDHDRPVAFYLVRLARLVAENEVEKRSARRRRRHERVGKIEVEASGAGRAAAGGVENHVHLYVRHRVGRHQQFETVETGDQVVLHESRPKPLVAGEASVHSLDALREERASAHCGVEDLHFRNDPAHLLRHAPAAFGVLLHLYFDLVAAGHAVREPEASFEQFVHGANDEPHDGKRSVPHAAVLAQSGVVGSEELLVEVDHRVGAFVRLAVILHYPGHV